MESLPKAKLSFSKDFLARNQSKSQTNRFHVHLFENWKVFFQAHIYIIWAWKPPYGKCKVNKNCAQRSDSLFSSCAAFIWGWKPSYVVKQVLGAYKVDKNWVQRSDSLFWKPCSFQKHHMGLKTILGIVQKPRDRGGRLIQNFEFRSRSVTDVRDSKIFSITVTIHYLDSL